MRKLNAMSADELATLEFLAPGESPNGRERWRFVVTPDGASRDDYLVSTEGRVVRVKGGQGARPGTILRLPPSRDGYPTVCLTRDGVGRTYNVHKLVATTFHGKAPEDAHGPMHAHHVDLARGNNRATNLEWTSAEENRSSWWHKRMSGR